MPGVTAFEVEPRTLPTPLLMLKEVGAPLDRVQARVEDWPVVIEPGSVVAPHIILPNTLPNISRFVV